jgi:hypothetical protein
MKEIHVEALKWAFFHEESEAFNAGGEIRTLKAPPQAGLS